MGTVYYCENKLQIFVEFRGGEGGQKEKEDTISRIPELFLPPGGKPVGVARGKLFGRRYRRHRGRGKWVAGAEVQLEFIRWQ